MLIDEYIKKSQCALNDCPYEYDITCEDCAKRMLAEHDAKVIKETRNECISIMKQLDGQLAEIVRRVLKHLDELKEQDCTK